jgi:DNA-binding NtrC family response regulator
MSETILIIDDETNLRKTLAEILRKRGYATLEASDGTEAISLLRDAIPELIFTDWKMPGMGGEEVLRYIRKDLRLTSVPVIVITAFGSSHSAIEAVRLGAYDFVTKPFDLEEIALTAKRALAHSSLNRELTELRAQVTGGSAAAAGLLARVAR